MSFKQKVSLQLSSSNVGCFIVARYPSINQFPSWLLYISCHYYTHTRGDAPFKMASDWTGEKNKESPVSSRHLNTNMNVPIYWQFNELYQCTNLSWHCLTYIFGCYRYMYWFVCNSISDMLVFDIEFTCIVWARFSIVLISFWFAR